MKLEQALNQNLRDYRCVPFWSWNDQLEDEELRSQIRKMKDAGMGGFFMHARSGLKTEYLSEDWFHAVEVCMDEAEKQDMNAWCYDENGWPSGFAGMKLLENSENWAHYLKFEKSDYFDTNAMAVYVLVGTKLCRCLVPLDKAINYYCVYDCKNSSVVDILSPSVVSEFINETHEKYYEHFGNDFGNKMIGFFTDEPQYYRWDTAYSPVILPLYKKMYGADLLDTLGALFIDCDECYETRFRYWKLMNSQFVDSFIKHVYEWCEDHNCKLTGHAIEEHNLSSQMWCSAGVMPFYEYEHIPGCDWLGRDIGSEITPRQVSSVAQQMGKKQAMTESFACAGWDVTPKELKRILEWQYVNGINLFCSHLTPYSIRGNRKYDHPAFYSECSPWFSYMKDFNDYFTNLGYMLSESIELARVAVIHPIHSAYLTYCRKEDFDSISHLETGFYNLVEHLGAANIGHHYVDESMLERHGVVEQGKLIVGLCTYDTVIIPDMNGIDSSTLRLLRTFLQQGGRLYLDGKTPSFVDGKAENLSEICSNITFDEMQNPEVQISNITTEIRSTYRVSELGNFLYAVNLSDKTSYSVSFCLKAKGAEVFDLESKTRSPLFFEQKDNEIVIPLNFLPGQSFVILLSDQAESGCLPRENRASMVIYDKVKIVSVSENVMTIDLAELSYDNVSFEKAVPTMAISDRLLKERTNRKVYLKYHFTVQELPQQLYLEAEPMNIFALYINGKEAMLAQKGTLDHSFMRGDIAPLTVTGENVIVFGMDYFQNEQVYRILFDTPEVTESLTNCLTYDTEIEPIYLKGCFGVASVDGYTDDVKNVAVSSGNFIITSQPEQVSLSKINRQGFPFFAGSVTLELSLKNQLQPDCRLRLYGRFAAAEVFVNGNFVKTLLFSDICEIGTYLKGQENILTLKLTNTSRNLYGPFHLKEDREPYAVSPGMLTMQDTWENGSSELFTSEYAFVDFGIDRLELV